MENELINEGKSEQIQKQLIKLNNAALSNAENMIQRRINEKFGKAGSFFKVKVFANKEDSSPSERANPEKSDYGTSLYIVELMPRNFKANDKYGKYYKPYAEYHVENSGTEGKFAIKTQVINRHTKTWSDTSSNGEDAEYIKKHTNDNVETYYHFIEKYSNDIKKIIEEVSNKIVFNLAKSAKQAKELDEKRSYGDERTSDKWGPSDKMRSDAWSERAKVPTQEIDFNKKWYHVPEKLKKEIWDKIYFSTGQKVARELNSKYWRNGMSDDEHKKLSKMIEEKTKEEATEIFKKEMDKKEKLAVKESRTYFNY